MKDLRYVRRLLVVDRAPRQRTPGSQAPGLVFFHFGSFVAKLS
ncbi:MAG TPA: hypothetical protein VM163_05045 [bacterium]|nr:hypothetical protein [bacterium]